MSLKGVEISRHAVGVCFDNLAKRPGIWFNQRSEKNADLLFRKFLANLNAVTPDLTTLRDKFHISHFSLPISISSLFLQMCEDQIDLYQSEQSPRDLELDALWIESKVAYAKWRYELFKGKGQEFKGLIDQVFLRIKGSEALLPEFESVKSLFMNILSHPQMEDLCTDVFYNSKAKSTSLANPRTYVKPIAREDIIQTIRLVIVLLQKNALWLFPRQLQELKGLLLEYGEDFCILVPTECGSSNILEMKEMVHTLEKLNGNILSLLHQLLAVDFEDYTDNDVIDACCKSALELSQTINAEFPHLQDLTYKWADIKKLEDFLTVNHQLLDAYGTHYLWVLTEMLGYLSTSNKILADYGPDRSAALSFLPPPPKVAILDAEVSPLTDEELFAGWGSETGKRKKGTKRPDKKRSRSIKKGLPTKPALAKSKESDKGPDGINYGSIPPEPTSKGSNTELLIARLYARGRSRGFAVGKQRQILWSLEQMHYIQKRVQEASSDLFFPLLSSFASASSRVLEACLYDVSKTSFTTHNLKALYRRQRQNPPPIAGELYLGSYWSRFFFHEHSERIQKVFGRTFTPPKLLQNLYEFAEWKSGAAPLDFKTEINRMHEAVVAELESQLQLEEAPTLLLEEGDEISMQEELTVSLFEEIRNEAFSFLRAFPLPASHKVSLHLKQADAAWRMLSIACKELDNAGSYKELAFWSCQILTHLQSGTEELLHAIEFFKYARSSRVHEISQLAKKVGLSADEIGSAFKLLAYKTRYPETHLADGLGAQIIDEAELLAQGLKGFGIVGESPLLWKVPENPASVDETLIQRQLQQMIDMTASFLRVQVYPELLRSAESVLGAPVSSSSSSSSCSSISA